MSRPTWRLAPEGPHPLTHQIHRPRFPVDGDAAFCTNSEHPLLPTRLRGRWLALPPRHAVWPRHCPCCRPRGRQRELPAVAGGRESCLAGSTVGAPCIWFPGSRTASPKPQGDQRRGGGVVSPPLPASRPQTPMTQGTWETPHAPPAPRPSSPTMAVEAQLPLPKRSACTNNTAPAAHGGQRLFRCRVHARRWRDSAREERESLRSGRAPAPRPAEKAPGAGPQEAGFRRLRGGMSRGAAQVQVSPSLWVRACQ